jgi:hypothetical protein
MLSIPLRLISHLHRHISSPTPPILPSQAFSFQLPAFSFQLPAFSLCVAQEYLMLASGRHVPAALPDYVSFHARVPFVRPEMNQLYLCAT